MQVKLETRQKKRRASVFDVYRDTIVDMLRYRSSTPFIAKEINKKGKVNISVAGLMMYIRREKLRDAFLEH